MTRNLEKKSLADTFEYRDGCLYRKTPVRGSKVGSRFGGISVATTGAKYRRGRFNGVTRYEHGLVVELFGIDVPEGYEIDHIDQNGLNNRIENLRVVTGSGNSRNRSLMSTNKTGVCGVHFSEERGRWNAQIKLNNKSKSIGWYDTIFDAAAARISVANREGFHANHGKKRAEF